jgi:hypothetical protein
MSSQIAAPRRGLSMSIVKVGRREAPELQSSGLIGDSPGSTHSNETPVAETCLCLQEPCRAALLIGWCWC